MSQDALGDRMKEYEQREAGRRALPLLPICARIDGRCFSKWTKGLFRPFDSRLSRIMIDVTKFLVEETKAVIGYTQSDEISLVFKADRYESEVFFDGKIQKLTSVLASLATAKFNALVPERIPEKVSQHPSQRLAVFDCRVWTVPNDEEAVNTLLWRELDATKNSVSMAARVHYSHKELEGKSSSQMQEMLFQKGVNWNDYPTFFKRGTFVRRVKVTKPIEEDVRNKIPEIHRPPEGTLVDRHEIVEMEMPPFSKVCNRVAVIFWNDPPQVWEPDAVVLMPHSKGVDHSLVQRVLKKLDEIR